MVRVTSGLSSLGLSTGRCDFDGTELLIAMKCYFDGSEGVDSNGHRWVTLAGFAGSDSTWQAFDRAWSRMLAERYPIAPYIHMWEILGHEDPFERKAGWTDEKIGLLISSAIEFLEVRRDRLGSFSCRVDLAIHDKLRSEGIDVVDPLEICALMCPALAMQKKFRSNIEHTYVYFDRGEKFAPSFKSLWLAKRTPPERRIATNPDTRVWDLIAAVDELDMATNPAIQAADMIAWGTTRDLSGKRSDTTSDLRSYVRAFIPDDHAVIDEEIMRRLYVR